MRCLPVINHKMEAIDWYSYLCLIVMYAHKSNRKNNFILMRIYQRKWEWYSKLEVVLHFSIREKVKNV